jgi:radical SAM protein with 4Fe4S-binding SPASM domain
VISSDAAVQLNRGHRMNINADGTANCCVHEESGYGNVFESGITEVYHNMRSWHVGHHLHEPCRQCRYVEICQSGCRMSALGYFGRMNAPDPLMTGPGDITKHIDLDRDHLLTANAIKSPSYIMKVSETIRWANTIIVPDEIANKLRHFQSSRMGVTPEAFGAPYSELIQPLLEKGVLVSDAYQSRKENQFAGLSLDPFKLVTRKVVNYDAGLP